MAHPPLLALRAGASPPGQRPVDRLRTVESAKRSGRLEDVARCDDFPCGRPPRGKLPHRSLAEVQLLRLVNLRLARIFASHQELACAKKRSHARAPSCQEIIAPQARRSALGNRLIRSVGLRYLTAGSGTNCRSDNYLLCSYLEANEELQHF